MLTGDGTMTPEIRQSRNHNHRTGDCASMSDTRRNRPDPCIQRKRSTCKNRQTTEGWHVGPGRRSVRTPPGECSKCKKCYQR